MTSSLSRGGESVSDVRVVEVAATHGTVLRAGEGVADHVRHFLG